MRGKLKNLKIVISPEPRIKAPYFITFVDPKINELFISKISRTIKGGILGNLKRRKGIWINALIRFLLNSLM